MRRAKDAGARRRYGSLWLAIWGGVLSGGWLWPTGAYAAEAAKIDAGDTAWVLVSSALVLDDDGAWPGAVLRWPGAA